MKKYQYIAEIDSAFITNKEASSIDPVHDMLINIHNVNTRRAYISRLNEFARIMGIPNDHEYSEHYKSVTWHNINAYHVEYLIKVLSGKLAPNNKKIQKYARAPSTVNQTLTVIKALAHQLELNKKISAEQYLSIVKEPALKIHKTPERGRALSEKEIARLLCTLKNDKTAWGLRDLLIVTLMLEKLTAHQIVNIENKHLSTHKNKYTLSNLNEKEKDKKLTLNPLNTTNLTNWLTCKNTKDHDIGYLINPINKSERVMTTKKLTTQSIYMICSQRSEESELPQIKPSDFMKSNI